MVATAEAGRYGSARATAIPARYRSLVRTLDAETVEMSRELKSLIVFKPLNLFESWPMRGPFDAIFCRNVMIYFDKPTQYAILKKMKPLLKPDGLLFVGHSEALYHATDLFRLRGQTVYEHAEVKGGK